MTTFNLVSILLTVSISKIYRNGVCLFGFVGELYLYNVSIIKSLILFYIADCFIVSKVGVQIREWRRFVL